MASYNHVTLVGNLCRDPELRYTPKGTAIAKISIACNRQWTTESGEKKEAVTFINIDVWGRTAENLAQYKRKGEPLLIEGRIESESWDDKQTNEKKFRTYVVAEKVIYLYSARGSQAGDEAAPARREAAQTGRGWQTRQTAPSEPLEGDGPPESDDVPF